MAGNVGTYDGLYIEAPHCLLARMHVGLDSAGSAAPTGRSGIYVMATAHNTTMVQVYQGNAQTTGIQSHAPFTTIIDAHTGMPPHRRYDVPPESAGNQHDGIRLLSTATDAVISRVFSGTNGRTGMNISGARANLSDVTCGLLYGHRRQSVQQQLYISASAANATLTGITIGYAGGVMLDIRAPNVVVTDAAIGVARQTGYFRGGDSHGVYWEGSNGSFTDGTVGNCAGTALRLAADVTVSNIHVGITADGVAAPVALNGVAVLSAAAVPHIRNMTIGFCSGIGLTIL